MLLVNKVTLYLQSIIICSSERAETNGLNTTKITTTPENNIADRRQNADDSRSQGDARRHRASRPLKAYTVV